MILDEFDNEITSVINPSESIKKAIKKHIEDWLEQGGCMMLPIDEYLQHEDCYRKYAEYGCKVDISSEFVTISRR